jgi:hypothetical protein
MKNINEYAFAYPASPESYETIGCAIILTNDILTVYTPNSGIETLGECFLNYELFMSP